MTFKSYYVVWKPIKEKNRCDTAMFKSYYVVWKRYYPAFFILFEKKFKSYYVVWKRLRDEVFKMCFPCLNRTMQYGNQYVCAGEKYISVGLNRTMQYGNFS